MLNMSILVSLTTATSVTGPSDLLLIGPQAAPVTDIEIILSVVSNDPIQYINTKAGCRHVGDPLPVVVGRRELVRLSAPADAEPSHE